MTMMTRQRKDQKPRVDASKADILDTVRLGPLLLPTEEQPQHIAVTGSTGSGKTSILRLTMQDVIPTIAPGTNVRAMIYDAKQDVLSLLAAMAPGVATVTMNPFDRRGVAWDIARDVTDPAVAVEISRTLIPEVSESQPFFADAARHLTYGVMLSFMQRGLQWTLADLLRALSSPKLLRNVLLACRYTRNLVSRYFYDPRLLSNVLSTVATKMMPFEPLAAAWEHAERMVSVGDWIDNEFVLVLGNHETSKYAINTINRCIFKRACDLTINQSESSIRRNWFILDELAEIGRLDGLLPLCKKGRSKGACVVLAFQSVAGLRDAKLYGKDEAAEILDQIGHFAIGRVGPDTADWASTLIGEREIREVTISRTYGNNSSSVSHNESFKTQKAVLPSELMGITPCSVERGLTAYYVTRTEESVIRVTLGGQELFHRDLIPPNKETKDFVPRPAEAQLLEPWTKRQRAEFAPESKTKRNTRRKPADRRPTRPQAESLLDALDEIS
jgi:type IV secretory pathway TraG/TraD family ATPase VirD4